MICRIRINKSFKISLKNLIIIFLLLQTISLAQEKRTGTITHISSQHIYVQFDKTDSIIIGDTLYLLKSGNESPALIVKFISSRSCAGGPLMGTELNINDRIIAYIPIKENLTNVISEIKDSTDSKNIKTSEQRIPGNLPAKTKKSFWGRFSIQSSTNLNPKNTSNQRWRYSLSLNADSIGGSPVSLSTYSFFSYNTDDWQNVKSNLGKALKFYDLNIAYTISKNSKIWFGRRLNTKISSIGSIDGIQYQQGIGNFYVGGLIGSHPNFSDYGYNLKMFEYGLYIGRTDSIANSQMENTFAFFNQTNNFNTDRRYIYLQHSNNVIKNINFFISSEIDLFKKVGGIDKNNFSLTSLYLSMYVNPVRFLSFSFSFDARRNVVYYETYKSFIDSLFTNELNQGYRAGVIIRPFNNLSLSLNGGYRFQNNDLKPARNFIGNLYYANIPLLDVNGNISYSKIISSYTEGTIAGLRLSKYISLLDLNISTDYRRIEYKFSGNNSVLIQNNLSTDISYKLPLGLFLGLNYELIFDKHNSYTRIFINITKRF